MRLGVIASHLLDAVATALALAEAGTAATITLDGPPPGQGVPVLVTDPSGIAAAVARLVQAGCTHILATHAADCSGPVGGLADALVAALGTGFAVACPARPESGLTVYQGHVFRRQSLLHGAAPGDRSSYVRLLAEQSEGTAGLVPHQTVRSGTGAIRLALSAQRELGRRIAVTDALDLADLHAIAGALGPHAALLGTPALAAAFVAIHVTLDPPDPVPASDGPAVILAAATTRTALYQAGHARTRLPHTTLGPDTAAWARLPRAPSQAGLPLLITAIPGRPEPAAAFAALASGLAGQGFRRVLVTGTTTPTAVTAALGVTHLHAGPAAPWLLADTPAGPFHLALLDGDWGGRDLFLEI